MNQTKQILNTHFSASIAFNIKHLDKPAKYAVKTISLANSAYLQISILDSFG